MASPGAKPTSKKLPSAEGLCFGPRQGHPTTPLANQMRRTGPRELELIVVPLLDLDLAVTTVGIRRLSIRQVLLRYWLYPANQRPQPLTRE